MLVPGGGCLQKETEGGSAVWELVARRVGGWSIQMLDRFSQLQIDEILDLRFSSKTLSFFASSLPYFLPSWRNELPRAVGERQQVHQPISPKERGLIWLDPSAPVASVAPGPFRTSYTEIGNNLGT